MPRIAVRGRLPAPGGDLRLPPSVAFVLGVADAAADADAGGSDAEVAPVSEVEELVRKRCATSSVVSRRTVMVFPDGMAAEDGRMSITARRRRSGAIAAQRSATASAGDDHGLPGVTSLTHAATAVASGQCGSAPDAAATAGGRRPPAGGRGPAASRRPWTGREPAAVDRPRAGSAGSSLLLHTDVTEGDLAGFRLQPEVARRVAAAGARRGGCRPPRAADGVDRPGRPGARRPGTPGGGAVRCGHR
jgi:hypothetical protein